MMMSFGQWLKQRYKITEIELHEGEWVWNYICEGYAPDDYTKDEWILSNINNIIDEYSDYIEDYEKANN